jgi:hypothetical protein
MIDAGDIIWVTSVQPEAELSHPALRSGVEPGIQAYHRSNGIRRFSSLRPFLKDSSVMNGGHGGTGILTWTEKTTLISECSYFPRDSINSGQTTDKTSCGYLAGLTQPLRNHRCDI